MSEKRGVCGDERWARFRFSVIGPLLAAPPGAGELRTELQRLAGKKWRHPVSGQWVQFGASTIERWYYLAHDEPLDPVGALSRKVRADHGTHPSLSAQLRVALTNQYREHPGWSYQLHAENLAALASLTPELGPLPSGRTIARYMQACGLTKRPRRARRWTAGVQAAERHWDQVEVRSYESEYVNALWHLDFHNGSLRILLSNGQWAGAQMLAILDDHSRLCVHGQWYLNQGTEELIHGICQGFEKRGLPRALMSDNGAAMIAAETVQGLERLGIVHELTLPYSPYQNGKQEVFWAQVEGRLLAMLENCADLSLARLNEATQAWLELDYNRKVHSELGCPPLERFVKTQDVCRPCPASEELRQAFTAHITRHQRRSDGTLTVEGVRFEVPSRYRQLKQVSLRVASWDLSQVHLADPRTGQVLCRLYPLDKRKNADGCRRKKAPLTEPAAADVPPPIRGGMAPKLRQLIAQYAATGLPPAYLPKDDRSDERNPIHE